MLKTSSPFKIQVWGENMSARQNQLKDHKSHVSYCMRWSVIDTYKDEGGTIQMSLERSLWWQMEEKPEPGKRQLILYNHLSHDAKPFTTLPVLEHMTFHLRSS